MAVFWDTPPRSSATAFLNEQQVVMPGADDQVRVIVQLRDEPVANYIRQSFGASRRLNSAQAAALQQYTGTLSVRRQQFLTQIRQQGVGYQLNREYAYVLNGIALSIKMSDWQRIAKATLVKAVFPDYTMRVALNDSVPLIGAPDVWAMNDASGKAVTGQGIRVAIIDTGVDYTHPDLGGCFGSSCRVVGGYDFVNRDNDPMDDHGHGTHVAGIVAARGVVTGVAPSALLLAYKVLDAKGEGKESDIIAALELAANPDGNPVTDDGAHVANLSLGGDGDPDDPLCQAVDNAVDQGMIVVVAAGNSGSYQSIASPGVARKAITVAASHKMDTLAYFSSRGPVPGFDAVLKPDITAPGVDIYSTVPVSGPLGNPTRYRNLSGTSMATPHVAGAAALLKQLHPTWTPELIKANMMNTAQDLSLSPYDQGAGRLDLTQTVSSRLVAAPGNFSFGIPLITGTTSFRLSVTNIATTTITATALISAALWADAALALIYPTIPVTYAQLSADVITIPTGATEPISITLTLPDNVAEGYYTGKITLLAGNERLVVPFAFTMLSRVTLRILDENGVEFKPSLDQFRLSVFTVMVRMPNADLKRSSRLFGPTPFIYYVPSGSYNIHAYMNFWLYDVVKGISKTQPKPFILFGTTTIGRNQVQDVYLSAATAHHTTLNAADFSGEPLFIARWRAALHYQSNVADYTTGLSVGYAGETNVSMPPPLPAKFDFYISDTPRELSLDLGSDGYGYSPRQQHFRDLNSAKWYADDGTFGFNWMQNADEVFWFVWHFPTVDANFPSEFRYNQDQVSHYQIKYNTPGTIDLSWDEFGNSLLSGADFLFYLPTESFVLGTPISAGMQRDLYVRGPYTYRYSTDHIFDGRYVEREFYTQDWSNAYTTTIEPDVWLNSGWDVQPLPIENQSIDFGAGPMYPALTFDNSALMIRLIHPIFGTGQGNKAVWGSTPMLMLTASAPIKKAIPLQEYWWSPSPMRQIPTNGSGDYNVRITQNALAHISYDNTIEARFRLPSADMNPPRVTGLIMPQRFALGQSIPITLTVDDAESGMRSLDMRYSIDEGKTWTPLTLTKMGTRYTSNINPGAAITVSLAFTATDNVGNYLAFTTLGASIRETPVMLNLNVSPGAIPVSSAPFTLTLNGTLRKNDNQPLSTSALPISIYLNDQFAGYVRDVALRPTFQFGTIGFDWTFIPTDFVTRTGTTQLKFVFDIGTYARQEQAFTLPVVQSFPFRYYFPFLRK